MKSTFVQLTLRRWAEISVSPNFYALLATFILVGAVLGPYGSFAEMSFLQRLTLSIEVNTICWFFGISITTPVRIALCMRGMPGPAAMVIGCLVASMAIVPALYFALQYYLELTFTAVHFVEHAAMMVVLVVTIAALLHAHAPIKEINVERSDLPTPRDPNKCPLQSRLPADKRGVLYAMVAQDHYVEFITDKGSELVLMRLSDAVERTNPRFGLQVHRSAWVSIFGINKLRKSGRNKLIVLPNGRTIPVSRNMQSQVSKFTNSFNETQYPDGAFASSAS